MKVALLELEKFRGVESGKIQFADHSVLIGPNNSGKTTIVEALALVLGRDRLVRNLTEHDFFGSSPAPADRLKIVVTLTDFGTEDFGDHPDWFRDGRAVPLWFDPETGNVLPERTHDRQKLACQIVFVARFDRESLEVETIRHFNDGTDQDPFADEIFVSVPPKNIRDIGFFLMPASRSWDRMLSFSSELFRRVIRTAAGLPAETILEERDRLRDPELKLEDDARLKPVVDSVNEEIVRLMGASTPLHLRLTTTDSAGVLEAVVPHFTTKQGGMVPAKRQGSGLVSLQSLFLLLHFGQKRIEEGGSFLMVLEEPELHLPPSAQRRVLTRLQSLSTQTVASTHSPLIASYSEPTSLLVVRNDGGRLTANPLLPTPLQQGDLNPVRRLYQIQRVETVTAIMSDCVLVPEGRTDFDWLALLLRTVELGGEVDADFSFGSEVGVVPTPDAKVRETCSSISKAHPRVVALVDGDRDGRRYADALDAAGSGVSRVILWPNDWTLENVLDALVGADEAPIIARLNRDLATAPGNRATLLARLKSDDRQQHGLKNDGVAYEIIASALAESAPCRARVKELLQGMTDACFGRPTALFNAEEREGIPRLVFVPWP